MIGRRLIKVIVPWGSPLLESPDGQEALGHHGRRMADGHRIDLVDGLEAPVLQAPEHDVL